MSKSEMIQLLCRSIPTTAEEAKANLEANEWDVLAAGRRILLQRERARKAKLM